MSPLRHRIAAVCGHCMFPDVLQGCQPLELSVLTWSKVSLSLDIGRRRGYLIVMRIL